MYEETEDAEMLAVAYHEAGHAVAMLVLGYEFSHVAIGEWVESLRAAGNVVHKRFGRDMMVADKLVIILAGPIALAEYEDFEDIRDYYCDPRADGDMETAEALAEHLSDADYTHCEDRAIALVRTHWNAIDRIAIALYCTRLLSYRKVAALFAPPEKHAA